MKFIQYILCFYIGFFTLIVHSQHTSEIDSLKNVLITQTGVSKIKALDELAWIYRGNKDSLGIKYALESLKLSREATNYKYETRALNILGKAAKVQAQIEDAEYYFKEALEVSNKYRYIHGIARGYNELGLFYRDQERNVEAIEAFLYSRELFESEGNLIAAAKATTNLAKLHMNIEAYAEALKYYQKSLTLREQLNDDLQLAIIYRDLGTLSRYTKNYDEMLQYSLKSKQLFEKLKRYIDVFHVSVQVAESYYYLDQNEKSKETYLEALRLVPLYKIQDASNLYHNFATFYKKIDQQDSALYYYQKAQKIFITNNDNERLSVNYNNLGNLYIVIGDRKKALTNFNKSLVLQRKVKDSQLLAKTYSSLSVFYKEVGDYSKAYAYKDSSVNINEKINDNIKKADRQEVALINKKRELEKEKNEAEVLAVNAKLELSNQRRNTVISIIVLVVIVLLLFILLRVRKLQQEKKVAELAFEKQKIKAQLEKEQQEKKLEEMLQDQERKAITSMITGQEEERKRIAEDLHDRLGSMLSVVKIHYKSVEEDLEKIKNETKSQYEKANQLLDEACETVRKIAHNMVSGTLTKFGLIPALKELKQKIEETKILEIELLAHGLDNRLNNTTEIQLYRIIQELLNNILKHANATEVTIQLLKREGDLNIMVSDNGVGFNVDEKEFEGMGLKSIKARVAEMNGQVLIDSSKGNGATVTIEIPTKK